MSKISVMSEHLANRIAAGEVIERPASVVKELVENAIDAGASHIRINVERAGTRLIAVADDGCGMDADDALLCIEPHGTSKLLSEDALNSITTLGFRGEALPSIAAVSKLSLVTRTAGASEATRVRVESGRVLEASPAAGATGTGVQVRDLFYNTPARKKFLKSPATEYHHIEEVVMALAIPNFEVAFELVADGRTVFNSPGADSCEVRLREFFGRSYADALWPMDYREGGIHISGYAASPGFTRNSRRDQRCFINRRAVEAQAVYRGIRDGYAVLSEPGRYAPVVLFITMDPGEVDVNVHPAKREVRFRSEFAVSRAVAGAIGRALRASRERGAAAADSGRGVELEVFSGGDTGARRELNTLSGKVPMGMLLSGAEVAYRPATGEQCDLTGLEPDKSEPGELCLPVAPEENFLSDEPRRGTSGDFAAAPPSPGAAADARAAARLFPETPFTGDWPDRVIGVLADSYILAEGRDGLVLIDQHAAHERVLYEQLLERAERGVSQSQSLLIAENIDLPAPLRTLLLRNAREFEALGFDFESLGGSTVMISAMPANLPAGRGLETVLSDMLNELLDNSAQKLPVERAYIARAACRAAVKAHDRLGMEEAQLLLEQLAHCRQGTLCPHGRPTMIDVSLREIEKRFARR